LSDANPIRHFFLRYLSARGAWLDEPEPGVFRMLDDGTPLPPGAAPLPASGLEFTFDPEAAAEASSRELLTFGNPLLERAIQDTLAAGRVTHLFAPDRSPDERLIEDRLRARVGFDRVRFRGVAPDGRLTEHQILRIQFVLSLLGDVTQQFVVLVHVDAGSARPAETCAAESARLLLHTARPWLLPMAPLAEPDRILATAIAELARLAEGRLAGLRDELRRQGEEEEQRVRRYFGSHEEELAARRGRLRKDESVERLEQALAAARAERDQRLHDVRARFRPRVETRLGAVEVLHLPRWTGTFVVERGLERFSVPLVYDVNLGQPELPACPSCGKPAALLVGERERPLLACGSCRTAPPAPVPEPRAEPEGRPEKAAKPPPETGPPPARSRKAMDGRREPAREVAGRLPRRPRDPDAPQPPKAEPLCLEADYWLLLLRIANREQARTFSRRVTLGERPVRELMKALDTVYKAPGLTGLRSAGRKLVAIGLTTFVADFLPEPAVVTPELQPELFREVSERLNAGKISAGDRFLHPDTWGLTHAAPARGADPSLFWRAAATVRVGPMELIRSSHSPVSATLLTWESTLKREFGLLGKDDRLWLIGHAWDPVNYLAAARRCRQALGQASPGELSEPDSLRRRLCQAFSQQGR
jgi:hypothetical protein